MPTIEVGLDVTSIPLQRRFAKKLSLWMTRKGIPISHTIVKFRVVEPSSIYSGPYPFDQFPGESENKHFAFVNCYVSHERSREFKKEMASCMTDAFQPDIYPEKVFINFLSVDPQDYFNGFDVLAQKTRGSHHDQSIE
ncbi:hypothetical protein [Desmospora profundinema]|uniref:Phenylpyruvate tautomerase PptA (4-oxalocrotonate tautomerase family) n=1 Tax=Desmospora profundinema TaxID=1571184 RepID=A0ABU1IP80_9BACL|nr:hypothetical protein [Desmospora profundinema]MDR6226592.1 phenylpyruvate tautomerase PptA (4-oxalocrotonate tautomerase family) [Desmospora profundinema]